MTGGLRAASPAAAALAPCSEGRPYLTRCGHCGPEIWVGHLMAWIVAALERFRYRYTLQHGADRRRPTLAGWLAGVTSNFVALCWPHDVTIVDVVCTAPGYLGRVQLGLSRQRMDSGQWNVKVGGNDSE